MRNILITGGAGSLGTALTERLLSNPAVERVACLSRDEFKHSLLRQRFPDPRLRTFLGTVREKDRLWLALRGVDTVIHAAALKRIDALEYDPGEAARTNVLGAMNLIEAAEATASVRRVLQVSTDKACSPSSVYGASKLFAERLFAAANSYSGVAGPVFASVRYGNVAGSRGSVIPTWRAMLAVEAHCSTCCQTVAKARAGEQCGRVTYPERDGLQPPEPLPIYCDGEIVAGPILPTVTDPGMTRFWITMPKAVDLVMRALEQMRGGEVFIPKLPSFRVVDLWQAMCGSVGGLRATGFRRGEKLHESMISTDEARDAWDLGQDFCICRPVAGEAAPRTTGRPLPDGFQYSSGDNTAWLTTDDLRAMV